MLSPQTPYAELKPGYLEHIFLKLRNASYSLQLIVILLLWQVYIPSLYAFLSLYKIKSELLGEYAMFTCYRNCDVNVNSIPRKEDCAVHKIDTHGKIRHNLQTYKHCLHDLQKPFVFFNFCNPIVMK